MFHFAAVSLVRGQHLQGKYLGAKRPRGKIGRPRLWAPQFFGHRSLLLRQTGRHMAIAQRGARAWGAFLPSPLAGEGARRADEGDLSSDSEPDERFPSSVSASPIHLLPQGEKE